MTRIAKLRAAQFIKEFKETMLMIENCEYYNELYVGQKKSFPVKKLWVTYKACLVNCYTFGNYQERLIALAEFICMTPKKAESELNEFRLLNKQQ